MNFQDFIILVAIIISLTACAGKEDAAKWPEAQAGQCANPINGIYQSTQNQDYIKFQSDCTGSMLACNHNFVYRNPGTNNETMIYVTSRLNSASCMSTGYHHCKLLLMESGNLLVFQCGGGDPVVYNRVQ